MTNRNQKWTFPPQCLCWLLVTWSKNSSLPPDPKYKSVALQTAIPRAHTFFLFLERNSKAQVKREEQIRVRLQRFSGFWIESRAKVSPDTFSCWGGTGHSMVSAEPSHSEQPSEAEKTESHNGLRKLIWGRDRGCCVWSCSDCLTVNLYDWLSAVSARGKAEGFVYLLKSNITHVFGRALSRISILQWRRETCELEISRCHALFVKSI